MRKVYLVLIVVYFLCGCSFSFSQITGKSQKTRIVGGNTTSIESIPYQVSIQSTSGSHFCGGTLIDEEWIVTAAHCLVGESTRDFKISAGITDINETKQERTVELFINHPGYDPVTSDNDIALVKLSSPLTINAQVKAIAYATSLDVTNGLTDAGVNATVSGWGATSEGASTSSTLLSVVVPIVSFGIANEAYKNELTQNMLPAGFQAGGKDACQGDSGGPLVVPNSDSTDVILAGVVSFGDGCARPDKYGIYTRVSNYESWIQRALSGDPIASINQSSQYVKQGADITLENLSINYSTNSWNVLFSGSSVFTSTSQDLSFTPSFAGDYTVTLLIDGNGTSDSISANFTILSDPESCNILSDFDVNNQQIFTSGSNNKANSEFAYSMGLYHANPSLEFLMEVKAMRIHFTSPAPTSTRDFVVFASSGGGNDALQTVTLSDYTADIMTNGYASIPFDEPLYLNPDQDFYADVDGRSVWANIDEFTIATSQKNSGLSYYYDNDTGEEISYVDLELGIEIEYCLYDAQPIVQGVTNESDLLDVSFFPNPISNQQTSTFKSEIPGDLIIKSIEGVKIYDLEIHEGSNSILTEQLTKGAYIWEFLSGNGAFISGKILIN